MRPGLLTERPPVGPDAFGHLAGPAYAHTIRPAGVAQDIDMTSETLAAALQRARTVLQRRPDMGLHDDAPATARLEGTTRVISRHANGTQVVSDMPTELGGSGDQVTPGWLFRAGLASCAATSIAMRAACEGIALDLLEVQAASRSDTRGVLGMKDEAGMDVYAGAQDMRLQVRIRADGVADEALRALVAAGLSCSPIPTAVRNASALALDVEIEAG